MSSYRFHWPGPSNTVVSFFMPCLRANFAIFHASCSAASPFEQVYLRRAAKQAKQLVVPSVTCSDHFNPRHCVSSLLTTKQNSPNQGYL